MTKIRGAGVEDAAAIARLEAECFSDPWSEAAISESLTDPLYTFTVAEEDGILGYIGAFTVAGEVQITNVAVTAAARRRGVGGALLDSLIALARTRGDELLTLEVRASNKNAQALYRSRGFAEVGRRKRFYSHPTEDGILMTFYL